MSRSNQQHGVGQKGDVPGGGGGGGAGFIFWGLGAAAAYFNGSPSVQKLGGLSRTPRLWFAHPYSWPCLEAITETCDIGCFTPQPEQRAGLQSFCWWECIKISGFACRLVQKCTVRPLSCSSLVVKMALYMSSMTSGSLMLGSGRIQLRMQRWMACSSSSNSSTDCP